MLLNWRSRFELDLMDFCKLRKRDPFGVLMGWILTLKDHATALVYLCALPRKRANLIAYKLQEIFGIIGYPMIFHTDNGKEFTAKVVLEFLHDLNPNILMVTGRPRCPSDQGSVENMNKFVKTSLMETSTNLYLQNLPTMSSPGGMKVTLCWNFHRAPNSKTKILIPSRIKSS
jgi:hypothetical protein